MSGRPRWTTSYAAVRPSPCAASTRPPSVRASRPCSADAHRASWGQGVGMRTPSPINQALLRHFSDLRDGAHGRAVTRDGKERLFVRAVAVLDPVARAVLEE